MRLVAALDTTFTRRDDSRSTPCPSPPRRRARPQGQDGARLRAAPRSPRFSSFSSAQARTAEKPARRFPRPPAALSSRVAHRGTGSLGVDHDVRGPCARSAALVHIGLAGARAGFDHRYCGVFHRRFGSALPRRGGSADQHAAVKPHHAPWRWRGRCLRSAARSRRSVPPRRWRCVKRKRWP